MAILSLSSLATLFAMFSKSIVSRLFCAGLWALLLTIEAANARGSLLATQTVAQWGGHETRTRCINEAKVYFLKKEMKTCVEWATDFKQHRLVVYMYGPDSISNPQEQLKEIADACLVAGIAAAGIPAVAASVIDLSTEVFLVPIHACLETQNVLSQVVAPGFELVLEEEAFW